MIVCLLCSLYSVAKIDIHYNEADKLITLTCQNTALFSGEIESVSDPEKEKTLFGLVKQGGFWLRQAFLPVS